ncbi:hypothetical protein [Bacillus sp. ISL-45]|uniref:hypothetical protein n=1 Tax=Bacillus sp. ISL-45 TaxID=2819128 RepID=UPI001BEC703A|nr:hypothetical protein [Bacillus sp. ISL-45]
MAMEIPTPEKSFVLKCSSHKIKLPSYVLNSEDSFYLHSHPVKVNFTIYISKGEFEGKEKTP